MSYAGITNKTIQDYIGIVKIDNTEYLTGSTLFGICKTAANVAIKDVEIEDFNDFNPTHGLTIHVLFYYSNTADSPPSLRIGGTTESHAYYPICATRGNAAGATIAESWREGAIVSLTFVDSRYDDDSTTASNGETDLSNSYWLINSSMDTGADPTSTVSWSNVTGASDLHAIENLDNSNNAATGYLKRTGANTWALQTAVDATNSVAGITTVGASGGAAAYEHTHGNITNDGKMSGSTVTGSVSSTDKFLREDGTWIAPAYTTNTDKEVKQNANTENKEFSILLKTTNDTNSETGEVKFTATTDKLVTINPSTGKITAPGGLAGNASTATQFASNATVKLTGDVTGTSSGSKKGWTISTTIADSAVTNAKLANSTITIGPTTKQLGGSFTLADIGLSSALRFIGTVAANSQYTPNENTPGIPAIVDKSSYTPQVGDVVLDKDGNAEYVCISITGTDPNFVYNWELLGAESSFALATEVINKSLFSAAYQLIYSTGANNPTVLGPNIDETRKFLRMTGTGSAGSAPAWDTLLASDIPDITYSKISDLSSWTGSSNISTVGTISSGTWQGTAIASTYIGNHNHSAADINSGTLGYAYGGTGQSSWLKGQLLFASNDNSLSKLDIGTEGYVLTVSSGVPTWAANAATDEKVTQNILATSVEDTYPLLVSAYKTNENTTTATTVNRVAAIYVKPKDGELYAGKFYGNGANITNITTDHINGISNGGTKYLRQDGWKVVTVGVNADNTNGVVVTNVGFNQGVFPSLNNTGKAASFQVSGGILTITAGSDATLTTGTLPSLGTISKATLSINGADS